MGADPGFKGRTLFDGIVHVRNTRLCGKAQAAVVSAMEACGGIHGRHRDGLRHRRGRNKCPLAATEVELVTCVSCWSVIVAPTMSTIPCAVLVVPIASTGKAMIAIPSTSFVVRICVRILAVGTNCLHLNMFAYMCLETPTSLDGIMHVFLHLWILQAQTSKLGETVVTSLGDGFVSQFHSH